MTPLPTRSGQAKLLFSDFLKMFQVFWTFQGEKSLFSQKSPIGGPESKKYYFRFFHLNAGEWGGVTLLMDIFPKKDIFIVYAFPEAQCWREIVSMTRQHDPLTSSQASSELHTEAEDSQVTVSWGQKGVMIGGLTIVWCLHGWVQGFIVMFLYPHLM